jgi:L-fuculose-phosphate aldolase
MGSKDSIQETIVKIGQYLYQYRYVVAAEGNISARISDSEIWITPSGLCKGMLQLNELIKVDIEGNILENPSHLKPTSELLMHLAIYHERSDVNAVVHAHPSIATGFSVAGKSMEQCVMPEMLLTTGLVPLVKYGTPATAELSENVGQDLMQAYFRMESLEHYARIFLTAKMLGGERTLNDAQISVLLNHHLK